MQAKSHLCLAVLTGEKRAVATGRRPNTDYRKRERLTETEIEKLIGARTARRNLQNASINRLLLPRDSRRGSPENHDLRADSGAIVKVGDVVVGHADATG